jgi:hypothetical protein
MKKPKPEEKKELELLASQLPNLSFKDITVKKAYKGSHLIQMGITTEGDKNKAIDPGKTYETKGLGNHRVNHFKRLRSLFMKAPNAEEGWRQVRHYYSSVMEKFSQESNKNFEGKEISSEVINESNDKDAAPSS